MQKTFKTLMMGLATSSLLVSSLAIAETSEELYNRVCKSCHGEGGNKPLIPAYPKLAGQNAEYTAQQMKDIKSGDRKNGLSMAMKALTAAVTDEQFDDLAKWLLGELEGFSAGKEVDMTAEAAQLFKDKGCNACHGDNANTPVPSEANGNPPIIVGQGQAYLTAQMKDIRDGKRTNGDSGLMKDKVQGISNDDFAKLAEWLEAK